MLLYSFILLFYLFLVVVRPIPDYLDDKQRKRLYFVILFPIFLLIALRSNTVGADTFSYSYLYEGYGSQSLSSILNASTWLESGYILSNYVFYHIGFSYYGFQIIVSIFYFVSFFWFLNKYSSNIEFSCYLIIARQAMFGMMNQTRMWLAICILLFSVDAFLEKKRIKCIVFIVLASSFHRSALCIVLLLVMLSIKKYKKLVRLCYLLFCCFVCVLGNTFFNWLTGLLGFYENYNVIQGNIKLASLVSFIGYLIFLLSLVLAKSQSDGEYVYHDFGIDVIICTLGLSVIGLRSVVMGRLISYFTVFLYGLVPREIDEISNGHNKRIIIFVIILLFAVIFFATMILRPNWDSVIPYKTIFN